MLEEERLDNEKRLMRWPLELRCRHVARVYAQGIQGSEPHLVAMCKKLMVGCPGKCKEFDLCACTEQTLGRSCEAPSGNFKGLCLSDQNCRSVCFQEGFTDGECKGFRQRCFCNKPC
ncbi:hypothetical protein RD792_002634 [Penstemon davidsonii]|uniref:Knottins-like domain-containing protein n=1 Tax=Penstemon davidsonii TaxID=160366 RepID=A0ABR0DRN6_9LAMI|nr:hypothetical protein RD792_002634 [Penstemon davidsonii]